MKVALLLMVKNESAILKRCLEAVEAYVDAFCICDTGSTDTTVEIAKEFLKTHKGCVTVVPWKHFGFNRTETFRAGQSYLRTAGFDLKDTYGLCLDADMVFVPGTLLTQTLTEVGYTVIQCNGNLEYPNIRLVRMDHNWQCLGVTHEYWDNQGVPLPKSVCYIDDRNDGGCKSDKFQRDARLLEQGLIDEPDNVRYLFYLAQTYHSLGRYEDAVDMYAKRIAAGGWPEEVWYSHYMTGESYKELGMIPEFEMWMLLAIKFRPSRAEPYYKLARYFREVGQHYKAYHYVLEGARIPLSTDSLFVEVDVYKFLFDYEATILMYYLGLPKKGLLISMDYMTRPTPVHHLGNVYDNLGFYIEPLGFPSKTHPLARDAFGEDYHPTSVSMYKHKNAVYHNVRFVNYTINPMTGSYIMKENGSVSESHKVRTQNVWFDPTTGEHLKMLDSSVTVDRRSDAHIVGLEDVRVYTDSRGNLKFTATTWEYTDKIRIMHGSYRPQDGMYADCRILNSPGNQECEKNWIAVDTTDDIIYRWSPLEIGTLEDNDLVIHTSHPTPWFFTHLRGSSVAFKPMQYPGETWCIVHFVKYSTPRKYYHVVMRMEKGYKPKCMSLPFVFQSNTIEYCLGCIPDPTCSNLLCSFSTMDDNPRIMSLPISSLTWIQL